MMKKSILFIWLFMVAYAFGQENATQISLNATLEDNNIPAEARSALLTKMQRALTVYGFADNGYTDRFVLLAKVNVISKDIVPTTPPRISQTLKLTFIVGDIIEKKMYESCEFEVAGIGTNETKATISAFQKVNPQNRTIMAMLEQAKEKIVTYYSTNCDMFLQQATALASMGRWDEAIFQLMSVPGVCRDCQMKCQATATQIYKKKIDAEGRILLDQARAEWTQHPDVEGAVHVAEIIARINVNSAVYEEIGTLQKEIAGKLDEERRKEWEFKMKQYEDDVKFRNNVVDACRAVGEAFGKNQPKSVVRIW